MARRLVFGYGYVGSRVADKWLDDGDEVHVVTRSASKASALAIQGFRTIQLDVASNWTLFTIPPVDTVLFAIGFDRSAPHDIRSVYVNGFAEMLKRLSGQPQIVYLSSTGVYANVAKTADQPADGEEVLSSADLAMVDEEGRCSPSRESGRCCLAAEQLLLMSPFCDNSVILRSAGIYGPGRVPNLAALNGNQPIRAEPQSWLNLIHVADLAAIVRLAAERTGGSAILNVADGHPVLRRDYYRFVSERYNTPEPEFVVPSERGRRGMRTSKRIDNRRLIAELGPDMHFASYQQGLTAILDEA